MASVTLRDVSFSYPVYDITGRSLKVSLLRQLGASSGGSVQVQALSRVSFDLKEGDRLGVIGRNGAGKSTLLRVLAGVYHPQEGGVRIKGRVVPLISRGLGMRNELSGYRNIELPMRLLGAKTSEIEAAKREIPEWTELGDFIHLPYSTYSDGMKARLLYAVMTAVRGDVLVMDEWLGAGDANFVHKANERMNEFFYSKGIVILCSHSIEIIRTMCNIVCWMERGQVVLMGPPETVIAAYLNGVNRPILASDSRISVS